MTPAPPVADLVAHTVFWASAMVVLYTYVGYPLLIALAARLWPAPEAPPGDATPSLSVIVAARDEEDCIEGKIRNCLALDYPADRLEILVVSDGSQDGTDAIVSGFAGRGVRLVSLPEPRGKAAALNAGVGEARGELLLLTDASEEIAPDAARALVARLGDSRIGAASGELHLVSRDRASEGVGLYWRYEKLIRRNESRFDSTVGVTGGLYALRRDLFVPLDPRIILDDVAIPMSAVLAGHRVVFEPRARARDDLQGGPREEFTRKRRTLAGNYQLLWLRPELLHPGRNRLVWQLLSHKVARLIVPWCLLGALFASAFLGALGSLFYGVAYLLQAVFYLMALMTALAPDEAGLGKLPHTFVVLNLAAVAGLFAFLRGQATASWRAVAPRGSA